MSYEKGDPGIQIRIRTGTQDTSYLGGVYTQDTLYLGVWGGLLGRPFVALWVGLDLVVVLSKY